MLQLCLLLPTRIVAEVLEHNSLPGAICSMTCGGADIGWGGGVWMLGIHLHFSSTRQCSLRAPSLRWIQLGWMQCIETSGVGLKQCRRNRTSYTIGTSCPDSITISQSVFANLPFFSAALPWQRMSVWICFHSPAVLKLESQWAWWCKRGLVSIILFCLNNRGLGLEKYQIILLFQLTFLSDV